MRERKKSPLNHQVDEKLNEKLFLFSSDSIMVCLFILKVKSYNVGYTFLFREITLNVWLRCIFFQHPLEVAIFARLKRFVGLLLVLGKAAQHVIRFLLGLSLQRFCVNLKKKSIYLTTVLCVIFTFKT